LSTRPSNGAPKAWLKRAKAHSISTASARWASPCSAPAAAARRFFSSALAAVKAAAPATMASENSTEIGL